MTRFSQRDVRTPHFAIPFTLGGINGGALVNEQDSEEELTDAIKTIVAYPVGTRPDEPDFGVPDLPFRQANDQTAAQVQAAINTWEPRVDASVAEVRTLLDQMTRYFRIEARGRENG